MKTQDNKKILKNIAKITLSMILVFFILAGYNNEAKANVQGTTVVVYLEAGQEVNSEEPNSLRVNDGVISIIMGDGSRVSFDFSGKEIN